MRECMSRRGAYGSTSVLPLSCGNALTTAAAHSETDDVDDCLKACEETALALCREETH
jgi:hypothetical protein